MPLVLESVKQETGCAMGEVHTPHLHYVKPGAPHEGVVVPLDDPRVSAKMRADLRATYPREFAAEEDEADDEGGADFPQHLGGARWKLSDGSTVTGKRAAAEKAEAALLDAS
jgi:hypothetical protein